MLYMTYWPISTQEELLNKLLFHNTYICCEIHKVYISHNLINYNTFINTLIYLFIYSLVINILLTKTTLLSVTWN